MVEEAEDIGIEIGTTRHGLSDVIGDPEYAAVYLACTNKARELSGLEAKDNIDCVGLAALVAMGFDALDLGKDGLAKRIYAFFEEIDPIYRGEAEERMSRIKDIVFASYNNPTRGEPILHLIPDNSLIISAYMRRFEQDQAEGTKKRRKPAQGNSTRKPPELSASSAAEYADIRLRQNKTPVVPYVSGSSKQDDLWVINYILTGGFSGRFTPDDILQAYCTLGGSPEDVLTVEARTRDAIISTMHISIGDMAKSGPFGVNAPLDSREITINLSLGNLMSSYGVTNPYCRKIDS